MNCNINYYRMNGFEDFINTLNLEEFDDANSLLNRIQDYRNANSKVNLNTIESFVDDSDIQDEEQLKETVKRLLIIENELDGINQQAKMRREAKKALREQIIEYMDKNDVEELNLPDGGYFSLRKNMKKVNPLTKKRLPVVLVNFYMTHEKMTKQKAEEKKESLLKFINDSTELVETPTLRRIK